MDIYATARLYVDHPVPLLVGRQFGYTSPRSSLMAADPSPQMQKTKKLVRVRKQVEVVLPVEVLPPLPPLATICKHKVHEWITPEDYTFRLLDLNLVLTLAAVGCAGLGFFLFPWNRALGMALAAAFFVGFVAHAKASMLLHWDVFPRSVLAILDRGRRLMAVACVAIVVVCTLRFGTQDGVRRATLFIWTVATALAALTGWVLRVERRVSAAAEFVELIHVLLAGISWNYSNWLRCSSAYCQAMCYMCMIDQVIE
uniref:Uncharacterized protein n=1 Tax=Oryza meridionalis TaxID=40149 RepID=A0A0E0CBR4_9ORYZ